MRPWTDSRPKPAKKTTMQLKRNKDKSTRTSEAENLEAINAKSLRSSSGLTQGTVWNEGKEKYKGASNREDFSESREIEWRGPVEAGTFVPTPKSQLPEGTRIFGSHFIDEIKRANGMKRRKSRLIAKIYSDVDASMIDTNAPSIQRFSKSLTLSLAASFTEMQACRRDVPQAYVPSKSDLERKVNIKAPKEMRLPPVPGFFRPL